MATWQQGINSGSFLAGIGQNNQNAPQASDANAALAFIRQNNEDERSGRNNVGLQALQGLGSVASSYQQAKQAELDKQFNSDYASAMQSGDRQKVRDLMTKYPGQMEKIQSGMKWADEDQRNEIGNLAASGQIAASMGTDAFNKWVTSNSDSLSRQGVSPQQLMDMHQKDPQGTSQLMQVFGMHAMGPEKYWEAQDRIVGRQIDQGKLAEQVRSNQAGEAIQQRGQDISRENSIRSAYAPTAAMQNYNQYAQMLKTDPEGAQAFAAGAGINTSAKKLMKVEQNPDGSVTKYYTDGSEEQGKLGQPISGEGIKPISLPAAQTVMEKAPEGAKKAAGFAFRVRSNLDAMDQVANKVNPQRIALINTALGNGTISNLKLSEPEQQYVALGSDAIAAVLRQETGAAITPSEQTDYYKRYFPQVGDSEGVVKTKRNLMENQFKSLKAASGRAYDALQVMSAAEQPSQNAQPSAPPQQGKTTANGSHTSKSGISFTVE